MKTLAVIAFILLYQSFGLHAVNEIRPKQKAEYCLKVKGKIISNKRLNKCKALLLLDDLVVDSIHIKKWRPRLKFKLKKNQHYTIRLSQPGYLTRTICIKTDLPPKYNEMYSFIFQTNLVEDSHADVKNIEADKSHSPIAKIFFDEKKECFYYRKANNSFIVKEPVKPL